ncbi:MAG: hypothetical protein E8A49_19975 [Phenylobacterium sp.]|nr:MAG: hypothetical protein E8A49_19975 [Phenylobacterium sp.]
MLPALSACGGKGGDESEAKPPPPDTASNFAQPLDAHGASPAWSLKVRGTALSVTRYAQADATATSPGADIQPHSANWLGTLPNGQTMKVTLYASPCTDPETGRIFPFVAEVDMPDDTPLSGCGGPAGSKGVPPAPVK